MNGLSREGRLLAAILVITIPTIEVGGAFLLAGSLVTLGVGLIRSLRVSSAEAPR
jgi:hypothetical protein